MSLSNSLSLSATWDFHPLEIKGDFLLNLSVDVDTSPKIHLLLYTILPSGELVAGSRNFTVEKCFSNKVKLWFSERGRLPGQKTQLHLSANPGSLCAIHAVDQSVFLLKPEAELSPEKVYNFIPKKDYIFSIDLFVASFNIYPCPTEEPSRGKRIGGLGHFLPENGDIYNTFWDFGVNIFTNTRLLIPRYCSDIEKPLRGERIGRPVHFLPEDGDAYKIFREFGLNIFTNTRLRIPGYCSDRGIGYI
ncbi:PREDICTED: alpha-2-macroglobulin-like [Thamnophis sirtalis]|uniref:Alpha-2-macroglobulin-like n=1 Tax=Thamnophis sirtalis TaxID=35019 RepID=A0A6I9XMI1_9SAUR|nr:PREDICTED: alpha-2-macroglobulin-like [Thamnophis sirtalis]